MSYSISDKSIVRLLVEISFHSGLRHVVISPGSRNAPLTISFAALPQFHCYSVVDERSAGFFALGLAQQLREPVALVCTSGSALLNYAPAVSEAYYQNVPLMVISADRPQEWIDQADGQTIRQLGVFTNFIRYACQLPVDTASVDDQWYANRLINEAFYHACFPVGGPVHINIPLREPLYGKFDFEFSQPRIVKPMRPQSALSPDSILQLSQEWQSHERIIILLGQQNAGEATLLAPFLRVLTQLPQVVVLKESLSNMDIPGALDCIDTIVSSVGSVDVEQFRPSLLLTFDGAVVSKMVKTFLRSSVNLTHWHISPHNHHLDTYRHLTRSIEVAPLMFLKQMKDLFLPKESSFGSIWLNRRKHCLEQHRQYVKSIGWSDLKAFEIIGNHIPTQYQLHLSNSSPIRNAQLFEAFYQVQNYCNRGTSGIDGCTSTAVGACVAIDGPLLLITGDLSFLYDSNALWNKYLSPRLRIILINNGGGDIFRFIAGEGANAEMDEYFVASHHQPVAHLAAMFGLHYMKADSEDALKTVLPVFFSESQHSMVLEVQTFASENSRILKAYFKNLKDSL